MLSDTPRAKEDESPKCDPHRRQCDTQGVHIKPCTPQKNDNHICIFSAIPNCGGYLDTLEGSFTSPNYPKPHPELAYCVWHIQVEKGYKIKLNFKEVL